MSLINQMLKDIEERHSRAMAPRHNLLSGLNSHSGSSHPDRYLHYLLGAILLAIIFFGAMYFWRSKPVVSDSSVSPALSVVHSKMIAIPVASSAQLPLQNTQTSGLLAVDPEQSMKLVKLGVADLKPPAALLEDVAIAGNTRYSQLVIKLNQQILYSVVANPQTNQVILTLENAYAKRAITCQPNTDNTEQTESELERSSPRSLTSNNCTAVSLLPETYGTAVKKLQLIKDNNLNVKLKLTLADGVELRKLKLSDNDSPQLVMGVGNVTAAEPTNENINIKSEIVRSENASGVVQAPAILSGTDKDYQRALILIHQQNIPDAIALLTRILVSASNYQPARETLVTLLLQQNQLDQAEEALRPGLLQQPTDAALVKLQARIFMMRGDLVKALATLRGILPSIVADPEYYAMVAALEQRMGLFAESAQIYSKLLVAHPGNAIWWMGLGIALENMGRNSDAIQAYHKAANAGTLAANLQSYIANRLAALGE